VLSRRAVDWPYTTSLTFILSRLRCYPISLQDVIVALQAAYEEYQQQFANSALLSQARLKGKRAIAVHLHNISHIVHAVEAVNQQNLKDFVAWWRYCHQVENANGFWRNRISTFDWDWRFGRARSVVNWKAPGNHYYPHSAKHLPPNFQMIISWKSPFENSANNSGLEQS